MREVKPELIRNFFRKGMLSYEEYLLNNKAHNENGPAFIARYENGQICYENYMLNGELHNENGPAYRAWDLNGQILCEKYYLNNKELSKEEFETFRIHVDS